MPQIYNTHFLVERFETSDDVKHVVNQALQTFPWFTAAWCACKQKYAIHVLNENHEDLALKVHILSHNYQPQHWWVNVSIARRNPHVAMYWRVFLDFYNRIGSFFQNQMVPDTHPEYSPRYTFERHILPFSEETTKAGDVLELDARSITNDFFPLLFGSLKTYALLQLARARISPADAEESGLYPVSQSCVWSGPVSWVHLFALWKLASGKDKDRAFCDLIDASALLCSTCKDKGFNVNVQAQTTNAKVHFDNAICIACFALVTI